MPAEDNTVRPFRIEFPEAELTELRRRVNATRWPERETVTDDSQGVRLALMQDLAHYWGTEHDWRACEAKLNALPQFMTEIDGLDIHFIHVRSQHEDALPLIVTHGWPDISIPFAISVFPDELYQAPRSWAERAYPKNLIYYNQVDRGGHFAAWEQPDLFAAEMRNVFRSLR
jgi:pimeloyl-ACP methyl ester carboxylesterase